MIIPTGSLINFATIIAGSTLGLLLGNRLAPGLRTIIFQGLGLLCIVIGLQMALPTPNVLVVMFSVLTGGIIGELLDLETSVNRGGDYLKRLLRSENNTFTQGFVTASMFFCIGSMVILGPLEEALNNNLSIILTKALLDGFTAMALSAALGPGVILSAVPTLIIEGLLTVFAVYIQPILTPDMITQLKSTGGILILGIGLNMLEITKIKLFNLLPSLLCAPLLVFILSLFN
ncbi:MAG: DUF554 domain-containing protein [Deltaproteobacteria bacterium]|nr:DUF554 domain-containing protein [Deltaproteobacteria bacterium]